MAEIEKKTKRYPTDSTDEEWARIEPFLPGAAKSGRPARTDLREVLNAIRYLARSGGGWRVLPKDFPPWPTVYWWFCRFARRFLFQTIHDVAFLMIKLGTSQPRVRYDRGANILERMQRPPPGNAHFTEALGMGTAIISSDRRFPNFKPTNEVFVVDDDENMRDLLAASLAPNGFPVTSFPDGESFMMEASARVPICVFLDIVMPGRSGLEILKELNARHYWAPVFLISACDDTPMVVEGIRKGAHDYLTKPFDRHAPALRVRDAIQVWTQRASDHDVSEVRPRGDWFFLTESEQELLAIGRAMERRVG
jgi:FixJ family two-component response regulator/transposase